MELVLGGVAHDDVSPKDAFGDVTGANPRAHWRKASEVMIDSFMVGISIGISISIGIRRSVCLVVVWMM